MGMGVYKMDRLGRFNLFLLLSLGHFLFVVSVFSSFFLFDFFRLIQTVFNMNGDFASFGAGAGAGAEFDDSGIFLGDEEFGAFADAFLEFTPDGGEAYGGFTDGQQDVRGEGGEEDLFFEQAFEPTFAQEGGFEDLLQPASQCSPPGSVAPSEAASEDSAVSLTHSLDDAGFVALRNKHVLPSAPLTTSSYTPLPSVLAAEPEPAPPTTIYQAYSSHFRTSADAKAYRRRPRLQPKSQATDVKRVKQFGRDYWVRRLYNAMVDTSNMTDGEQSIHRVRFTQKPLPFDPLDLEATAHHIFDEAIAVHERGWNRPTVYHKKVVRGKLVDLSETSVEMRLSRICLCLQQKKSSVDDAIRGGVTLALLCDNPEARSFTKQSNDVGNKKRGERLKVTSTKEKARRAQKEKSIEKETMVEKEKTVEKEVQESQVEVDSERE